MNEKIDYAGRRKRFMDTFKGDPVLTETLPNLASELFFRQFGITIDDKTIIPVAWAAFWGNLMEFIHQQKSAEFSVSVAGFRVEYMTEMSESDKARNIVPEMYHESIPTFTEKDHTTVQGCDFNRELTERYNEWRTNNLTETLDMVERKAFNEIAEKYGVRLMISATVIPLIAAIYAAGIDIALHNGGKPVNMYNWFTITTRAGDKIILTPLASIKQGLKDDSKRS